MTPEQKRQALADGLSPFTVIYTQGDDILWQFYKCWADDDEHAEDQLLEAEDDVTIVWVNDGHDLASPMISPLEESC
jgi:hypothetical protein